MRVIREIEVGGRTVQVRELTVGEIRAWLKDAQFATADVVDLLLFADIDLPALRRMTNLDDADLDAMPSSDVRQVIEAAREVNADFFAMRDRVMATGHGASTASSAPC
mgnify:CR=1 FL=1